MTETVSVLVATENPSQRIFITSLLQNAEYNVHTLSNGREVLDYLHGSTVDALILDTALGEINGLDLTKRLRIRKATQHIPIILISPTIIRDDDILSALLSGADDCIAQPFRPQELTLKLQRMLGRHRWTIERQHIIEKLLVLANDAETALLSSGEYLKIDTSININSENRNLEPVPEIGTMKGSWHEVKDAMDQALVYLQDTSKNKDDDEEETLLKSTISRLSTAVAQASLYKQVRAHAAGLQEANEKLQELDRLKSEFTNAIVHDIRSPLSSIIATLELIDIELQGRKSEFAELRELVSGACQISEKMIGLINELLDFSKYDSGSIQMEPVPVSPHEILVEVAENWNIFARRKNISIGYGCATNTPKVLVDIKNFHRALGNLLSNAIKFTPEGGRIWIEARIVDGVQVDFGRQYVVFSVVDSGEGIPAQDIPYIFDPYYQACNGAGRLGTGLGLAIVKRIAAAHEGNVSVRSQVGTGSAFSIVLPVAQEKILQNTNILEEKTLIQEVSTALSSMSKTD